MEKDEKVYFAIIFKMVMLIALATAGGQNILVKLMQNVTSPAQQHLVLLFPGSAGSNLALFPINYFVFL